MSKKQENKAKARQAMGRPARDGSAGKTAPPVDVGISDEARIEQVAASLGTADQTAVRDILSMLEKHLGSAEAARLWLVTRSPEFGTPPLTAIAEGKAKLVLAVLESHWGPNPTYA
jgi:hypothetical protein